MPLLLVPETAAEQAIIRTLVACSNREQTATFIRNNHDTQVWVIDQPLDQSLITQDFSLTALSFRAWMRENRLGTSLEPEQSVVIRQPYTSVHLSLSIAVQFAWQGWSAVTDLVKKKGQDAVVKWLSGTSKTRAAALTCGTLAFDVGSDLAKGVSSWDALDTVDKFFGYYTGTSGCVQAARAAENEGVVTAEALLSHTRTETWRRGASGALTTAKLLRGLRFVT